MATLKTDVVVMGTGGAGLAAALAAAEGGAKVMMFEKRKAFGGISVTAEDDSGNTMQVEAKTVVVASGGYAHNKEMLAKDGFELGRDLGVCYNTIPLEGDGIRMAWDLGAVPDGMGVMLTSFVPGAFLPFEKFPHTPETAALLDLVGWGLPYLWVNQHGERFMDEGNGNGGYIANAMARQKDKCFYLIFDGKIKRHIEKDGADTYSYLPGNIQDIDGLIQKALDKGMPGIFVADTLAELADKIGIAPTALQKNADDYNRCCEKGRDDLFAKNPKFLQPVKEPKFYAFKQSLGGYGTMGGIKINERAEAMDKNDEAIPGLYAAGDCANGVHPPNFSLGYILWGGQLSFAINSGRIAGENAAKCVGGQRRR